MKTPKEKAKQLIQDLNNIPSEAPCFIMSVSQCKTAALILTNEMLTNIETYDDSVWHLASKAYWQKVKREILLTKV